MNTESPVSIPNLIKWATILLLFVLIGCVFINVRAQQVSWEQELRSLASERRELLLAITREESEFKSNGTALSLEARLLALGSPLEKVGVERSEELNRQLTASYHSR